MLLFMHEYWIRIFHIFSYNKNKNRLALKVDDIDVCAVFKHAYAPESSPHKNRRECIHQAIRPVRMAMGQMIRFRPHTSMDSFYRCYPNPSTALRCHLGNIGRVELFGVISTTRNIWAFTSTRIETLDTTSTQLFRSKRNIVNAIHIVALLQWHTADANFQLQIAVRCYE